MLVLYFSVKQEGVINDRQSHQVLFPTARLWEKVAPYHMKQSKSVLWKVFQGKAQANIQEERGFYRTEDYLFQSSLALKAFNREQKQFGPYLWLDPWKKWAKEMSVSQ